MSILAPILVFLVIGGLFELHDIIFGRQKLGGYTPPKPPPNIWQTRHELRDWVKRL